MRNLLLAASMVISVGSFAKSGDLSEAIKIEFENSFYASFSGNTFSKMTNEQALVLLVNANAVDGEYNRAFVLTTESPAQFEEIGNRQMDVFIIAHQKTALLVDNESETITIVGLDNEDSWNVISRLEKNQVTAGHISQNKLLAFGMSYLEGAWVAEKFDGCTYKSPFNFLSVGDRMGVIKFIGEEESDGGNLCAKGKCTSGGAGSSSCDITDDLGPIGQKCHVVCNSGYYSCCNSKTVRCYCCKI
jgi:hypothetical protein